jgi:hypothetical protein
MVTNYYVPWKKGIKISDIPFWVTQRIRQRKLDALGDRIPRQQNSAEEPAHSIKAQTRPDQTTP